jgi:hypothetical protein
MSNKMTTLFWRAKGKPREAEIYTITPAWPSRQAFLESVGGLLERAQAAAADYVNSSPVLTLSEHIRAASGRSLAWSFGLDLKDLHVLAAITSASLGLRGRTDSGKTSLAARVLGGLFGPCGQGWARCEINRGLTVDDLIDVDVGKLSTSKLSQAISSAAWISKPAFLLDEVNRAHAKLVNILLHIVDGSGLNVRGDLSIPIGLPYLVGGQLKRYSLSILTANELSADTPGTFEEDVALRRRVVISHNLDHTPVTARDLGLLTSASGKRAKTEAPLYESQIETILRVYVALPDLVPVSALARLFLHLLWGRGSCVRTRSGRFRKDLQCCAACHLSKSHPFCGRVGGLSEGLLLWCKETAMGLAAIRAAKVLQAARRECLNGGAAPIQEFLGCRAAGEELYAAFAHSYAPELAVKAEDMVAAYTLLAPGHLWISPEWMATQPTYEKCEAYAFADVARRSWSSLKESLRKHERLFAELAENGELSAPYHAEVEALISTEDPAMQAVIAAFRDQDLSLRSAEAARARSAA